MICSRHANRAAVIDGITNQTTRIRVTMFILTAMLL